MNSLRTLGLTLAAVAALVVGCATDEGEDPTLDDNGAVEETSDAGEASYVLTLGGDVYTAEEGTITCHFPELGGIEWNGRMEGGGFEGDIRSGGGLGRGLPADAVHIELDHTVVEGWEWSVADPGRPESWWAWASSDGAITNLEIDRDAGTASADVIFGSGDERREGSFQLVC